MSEHPTRRVAVLDLGTTAIKAALVDEVGIFCALGSCPAPELDAELGTFDADRYASLALGLLGQVARDAPGPVSAISVSSQRATVLAVDGAANPLARACSWLSVRCAAPAMAFYDGLGAEHFRTLTGLLPSPIYAIAKLAAGDLPRGPAVAGYADLQAFLLRRLGAGALCIDPSNASALGLATLSSPAWSEALCAAVGISAAQLPDILPAGTVVGRLSRGAGEVTGLGAGTPLVLGGGDQQCAVLGAGAFVAGSLALSLGTAAALAGPVFSAPDPPPAGLLGGHHVVPGQWVLEGFIPTFGAAAAWAAQALGHADIGALARCAAEVPDSGGVHFVPSLAGSGSPDFDGASRGAWLGMSIGTTPAHLARAVFEGLACELGRVADGFEVLGPVEGLRVVGGGSRGDLQLQLIANTLGVDLSLCDRAEAALLGAAALAWAGIGQPAPILEAADAMGARRAALLPAEGDPGRGARRTGHAAAIAAVRGFSQGEGPS
jgi:xylulokinase